MIEKAWVVHQMLLTKDETDVHDENTITVCATRELAREAVVKCLVHYKRIAWSQGLIPSIDEGYETRFSLMGVIRNTKVGTIVIEAIETTVIESSSDFEECCI